MTEKGEVKKTQHHPKSVATILRNKIFRTRNLFALPVLLMVAISIILWQSDIDWREQVQTYALPGVFVLSLISGITLFFPLGAEAVLVAAPGILDLHGALEISLLGLVASVGATLGETSAYLVGFLGREVIEEKDRIAYGRVEHWMKCYGGATIFFFALTPLPFDLAGIAAGSSRFPIWKFLVYCWFGRLIRALIIVHMGRVGWDILFG